MIWDDGKVDLSILKWQEPLVHCRVKCITQLSIVVTFVYGRLSIINRRPLWSKIAQHQQHHWLVLGDFNSVLSPTNKQGGLPVTAYDTKDLLNFVTSKALKDLTSSGCKFTWKNGHICSKLDHVMVNKCWQKGNFKSFVKFLPSSCLSDHSSNLVSIMMEQPRIKKPFKFLTYGPLMTDFCSLWRTHGAVILLSQNSSN